MVEWAVLTAAGLAALTSGWLFARHARLCERQIRQERAAAAAEIHSLQEKLASRSEALQSATAELDSYLYGISHDLRSPLRAIDGFARLIAQDHAGQLDGDGVHHLHIILESTARLDRMIEGLTTLSRFARHPIDKTMINMTALADLVARELASRYPHAAREVIIDDLPPVRADSTLLLQVWRSLLDNAFRFSATNPAPRIHVGGSTDGSVCEYFVRDNGVGFDMRYASKLFGVFQRLHAERDFPGTGIGLAIAHRIVSRHGGRMEADAQPNAGACFRFGLPADSP